MIQDQTIQLIYEQFKTALNHYDKETCLKIAMSALESNTVTISILYEAILEKSLYEIATNNSKQAIGIWQEHIQSSIIRTVIENTYSYVIKHKAPVLSKKVIVFCPKEEYHDIGARMTTDFLTLLGFDAYFIGPNTPEEEVYKAIDHLAPDWICISVTNFFHLAKLQDFVLRLKAYQSKNTLNIMVGGYAIEYTPDAKLKIHADEFPHTFDDLKKIKETYYDTSL